MTYRALLTVFAVAAVGAASAADLGPANLFNAFIFNDAQLTQSDSFGSIAVGRDLRLQDYQVNSRNLGFTLNGMANIGLLVGRNLTAVGGAARVDRGNAFVKGSVTGTLGFNGGSLFTGAAVDTSVFGQQQAYSLGQSNAIRNLSGTNVTGGGPAWPNVLTIDLNTISADPDGRQVLRIDASVINANQNVALNLVNGSSNRTVIFDVLGTSVNWTWVTNYQFEDKLLWNFKDTTALTIGRMFDGSILAPLATVTQNELIEGNLIANNWFGNSRELHFGNDTRRFSGNPPVPEPATMTALAIGLAAVLRRRRAR